MIVMVLAGTQRAHGNDRGGNGHDREGADACLQVRQMKSGHSLQNAQRVGHEPEQPDHDAERVEPLLPRR